MCSKMPQILNIDYRYTEYTGCFQSARGCGSALRHSWSYLFFIYIFLYIIFWLHLFLSLSVRSYLTEKTAAFKRVISVNAQ